MNCTFHVLPAAVGFWILALLLSAAGQVPSPQQNRTWCENNNKEFSLDLQINGCTAIIRSGQGTVLQLTNAFLNRGEAYARKGEWANSIDDNVQALKLQEGNASANNLRIAVKKLINYCCAQMEKAPKPGTPMPAACSQ